MYLDLSANLEISTDVPLKYLIDGAPSIIYFK